MSDLKCLIFRGLHVLTLHFSFLSHSSSQWNLQLLWSKKQRHIDEHVLIAPCGKELAFKFSVTSINYIFVLYIVRFVLMYMCVSPAPHTTTLWLSMPVSSHFYHCLSKYLPCHLVFIHIYIHTHTPSQQYVSICFHIYCTHTDTHTHTNKQRALSVVGNWSSVGTADHQTPTPLTAVPGAVATRKHHIAGEEQTRSSTQGEATDKQCTTSEYSNTLFNSTQSLHNRNSGINKTILWWTWTCVLHHTSTLLYDSSAESTAQKCTPSTSHMLVNNYFGRCANKTPGRWNYEKCKLLHSPIMHVHCSHGHEHFCIFLKKQYSYSNNSNAGVNQTHHKSTLKLWFFPLFLFCLCRSSKQLCCITTVYQMYVMPHTCLLTHTHTHTFLSSGEATQRAASLAGLLYPNHSEHDHATEQLHAHLWQTAGA